jgi:hypothetical protein
MKIAIMQPYLFPYIGYFQLMAAVDTFVIYDDVQFIKNGWINRNRFLVNGQPHTYTFSVKNASTFLPINQREFASNHAYETAKFLKYLRGNYGTAPFFEPVYALTVGILSFERINVAEKITHSLRRIKNYLGLSTTLEVSSSLNIATDLQAQERVIALCKFLNGTHYVNAIGGQELYSREAFANEGIQLAFLKPSPLSYPQFGAAFVPNLSIIDVMMFNSVETVRKLLSMYEFV